MPLDSSILILQLLQFISMYLNSSQCISMHLNASQCISIHLNSSHCISMHLRSKGNATTAHWRSEQYSTHTALGNLIYTAHSNSTSYDWVSQGKTSRWKSTNSALCIQRVFGFHLTELWSFDLKIGTFPHLCSMIVGSLLRWQRLLIRTFFVLVF